MKIHHFFFACFLLVAFLSGCSPRPAPVQLRLAFRGDLAEIQIVLKCLKEFERQNPSIRVVPNCPSDYRQALASPENSFDVAFVEHNDFSFFQSRGLLADLTDWAAQTPEINLADYYPLALKIFEKNGRLFVLPRDMSAIACVYVNLDLFKAAGWPVPQPGWRWPQDLLPLAQKLTQTDAQGNITCYGFADDWPLWEAFVLSNGGDYLQSSDGTYRIALNRPQSLEAIQFRQDLIHKYHVMPNNISGSELFVRGKAAMCLGGYWKTILFREILNFRWDVVLFPQGPAGPQRFLGAASGYAVMRSTPHPREAWKLVSFLGGPQGQYILAHAGLIQPALRSLAGSRAFLDNQPPKNRRILLNAAQHLVFAPDSTAWQDFLAQELNPALAHSWETGQPVGPAIQKAVQQGNRLFQMDRNPKTP